MNRINHFFLVENIRYNYNKSHNHLLCAFLLIFCFILTTTFGQNQFELCANGAIEHKVLKETAEFKARKNIFFENQTTITYVPIKLHLVRSSDGTTSFNSQAFFDSFKDLNNKFKALNIQFYFLGAIEYIDDSNLYTFEAQNDESTLCNPYDVLNAINLYYVNTILFFNGLSASGYAYYPSSSKLSNRIIISNNSLNSTRTLSHEFGHYFNLLHTYNNNNNSNPNLREKVTRTNNPNCSTTGDMLCDTPADPYGLAGATTSNCLYTGTITDENNERYSPTINNTMSYYSPTCGDQFSNMQHSRMEEGYLFRSLPSNEYKIEYVISDVLTPSNLRATIFDSKIKLNFKDRAINEIGYLIERKSNVSVDFKVIGSLFENDTTYIDSELISNTTYTYRVRAHNSAVYSNEITITTTITRCEPQYSYTCDIFPINLEQFIITGTSLSNVNSNCSPNSYSIKTTNVPDLNLNQTYTFKASANTTNGIQYYPQHVTIWIDYNLDGTFSSTEIIYKSTATVLLDPELTASFKIPTTATPGLNVLRVRTQYADDGQVNDPCTILQAGETEDYTVNIKSLETPSDIKIIAFMPTNVCSGSEVNITYQKTGSMPLDSTQFIVQLREASGLYKNLNTILNGQTLTALIPSNQPAGSYKLRVTSSNPILNGSDALNSLIINVLPISGINLIDKIRVNQSSSFAVETQLITATYTWNFGTDASPASSTSVSGQVFWSTTGTKTITLKVTQNGCEQTYSRTIDVFLKEGFVVKAKILLEGMISGNNGLMKTDLVAKALIPHKQPFNTIPWNYSGTEEITTFQSTITDWILVVARRNDGSVLSNKVGFLRNDGVLLDFDQTEGIAMGNLTGEIYISIHHKSHIAVMTNSPITNNVMFDFSIGGNQTKGVAQQKQVGAYWCIYAGDFDHNCLNNNLDFNSWKNKGALVNQYLDEDADGNGIVNNLDFNFWARNRSKVGITEVREF